MSLNDSINYYPERRTEVTKPTPAQPQEPLTHPAIVLLEKAICVEEHAASELLGQCAYHEKALSELRSRISIHHETRDNYKLAIEAITLRREGGRP